MKIIVAVKGGPTSGNYGHVGRPGLVGGSGSGTGAPFGVEGKTIMGGKVNVVGPPGATEKVEAILSKLPAWHMDALTSDVLRKYLIQGIGFSQEGADALLADIESKLQFKFISDPEEFVTMESGANVGGSSHYNMLVIREEYLDDPETLERYVLHELGHQIDALTMRLPLGSTNYRYAVSSESNTFRSTVRSVYREMQRRLGINGANSPLYIRAHDEWKAISQTVPGRRFVDEDRTYTEIFAEAYYLRASGRGDQLPRTIESQMNKFFRDVPPKGTVLAGQ